METETLVHTAMKAAGMESQREFAKHIGVSHQSVRHWLSGDWVPSFEQCMALAQVAGLDPVRTAAAVRLNSKDAAPFRGLLRRLATAACVALAFGGALTSPPALAHSDSGGPGLYIMSHLVRRLRDWLNALRPPLLARPFALAPA
jgi:DNA-binding XRE family transcriptional regulator